MYTPRMLEERIERDYRWLQRLVDELSREVERQRAVIAELGSQKDRLQAQLERRAAARERA
jgi:hypothetical protein